MIMIMMMMMMMMVAVTEMMKLYMTLYFPAVSKAFSALSDPQEKKKYDRGGGGDGDLPSPFYGTPFNFDGYHFSGIYAWI